ncbi:MAG: RHS repeat-associated core domain-containing protein [Saprospiraceae bacterium]
MMQHFGIEYELTNNEPHAATCDGEEESQKQCQCFYENHCENILYYYHSDHIGSSTFLTDAAGYPYEFMLYLPFGEAMAHQKIAGWATPYTFTGKEQDVATGLHYFGARYLDTRLSIWFGVDPLASRAPDWSPYTYVFNNPIVYNDPDGRFPIDPDFRINYPQLTSFIENRLQSYIQNSPRMLSVLNKYSTENLNPSQIASDFKSDGGPKITGTGYGGTVNAGGGEYDFSTNTIKMDNIELARLELILNNPDATKQKWGEMDFTALFINEYTHYGDALDGFDAIQDDNGNVINSQNVDLGAWGDGVFDEGNAAAGELFPLDTGRQNYHLYNTGDIYTPTSGKPVASDKSKIDPTMIPPDKL